MPIHRARLSRFVPAIIVCFSLALVVQAQDARPRGQRGARGRGGRGGGAARFVVSPMLSQADTNHDQRISKEEMIALADAWYTKLDGENAGKLSQESFVAGLGDVLATPQASGQPGGGRRGFNPARFIGPGLFTATDADKDGSLTRAELKGTFAKWFGEWDADKNASLVEEELVAGLTAALPRRRGGGRGRAAPEPDDNTGFTALFDGKTLNNWDGDPDFWRVENGTIVAQSTPDKRVRSNTFLIWRGGTTTNFELKLEYRISDGANSGVQYRSEILSDVGPWAMKGYQADMDSANRYTGMVYEERGRGFLATRGQVVRIASGGQRKLVGSSGEADALGAFIKADDWNAVHIIARGHTLIHLVNGHVMSVVIDEDEQGRASEGLLGLQMHVGEPMKLEFRNIWYKPL